ncbi:heme o synthase [Humidisolicoccus flavus]|uniref:heme o synthase n=1 Tax=Humidisolicoccus flavus TaxID=3111414 RepID=UPI00324ED6EF
MTATQHTTRSPVTPSQKVRAFVALTKPRVVELLLITAVPVMFLAAGGVPNLLTIAATLVGGFLSAGSANAFNMVIDRDIDAVMERTKNRPLVTGVLSVREAKVFAWALALVSTVVLLAFTTWLAVVFSVAAIAFYIFIYTLLLKRRTEQNIVWGGIAGCFPVLIGWTAVTGTLSWAPIILFVLVFLWTPAHYWPLSMKYRDDYEAADVPMLAVVRGRSTVGLQVILYAWASAACTLLLIPVASMGIVYSVIALAGGIWFVTEAHGLYARALRGERDVRAMRVFHASNTYLTLVFLAVGIDPLLRFSL